MIKNNYFTKEYQTFLKRLKLESLEEYINQYQKTYSTYKSNIAQYYSNYINQLKTFGAEKDEVLPDSENEADFENNLFDEYASFDTNPELASSGYTTVLSDNEDKKESNLISSSLKDNKNNIFNNIFSNSNENLNSKFNDINESNYHPSEIGKRQITSKSSNNFINTSNPNSLNADGQANDRLNNLKINKNQLTIRPRTKEEIKEFQLQELERYKKPHLPWKYIHPDSSSSVVAPVQKKIPTSGQTKPRDHVLLKADRPSYVTILCLARDAAARLPEGVGTRADICDLLKDSQFTNERLSDAQINNIVSGALDRLHYEKDPCVKYDLQKKLWIYLHKNRTSDYQPWNEHLKKNNLSNTGEPLNPSVLGNDNNSKDVNAEEDSFSENKDDVAESNDELFNEDNFNEKNAESNQANSELCQESSKAGNAYNIFNDVENMDDSEINMHKKSKISGDADKKILSNNGNIISISRNFENENENDFILNLNEDNLIEPKNISDSQCKSGN